LRALVLVPTTPLTKQVTEVFKQVCAGTNIKVKKFTKKINKNLFSIRKEKNFRIFSAREKKKFHQKIWKFSNKNSHISRL
jgi:hypothetical protein